jgi:hypothetical protein
MTRHVVFTPRAIDDVDDASAWYEQQRPGLAERYRASLDEISNECGAIPKCLSWFTKEFGGGWCGDSHSVFTFGPRTIE